MFDSRQNLATAFAQLGPLAEDAATRAKPHGLSQQVLGPDHPEYAEQPPQQLAFADWDAGRLVEALPQLEQVITARERISK